ncbi:MurR/RpiR family transcriptional regulator [Actinomyces glycerinitolerans]|uniref:Sugar isomerase (Sis) n=1 Tax=Actinomyces glycerinitolerans TaxID=1892869 RepID=A0A1M4RZ35_9ACTO|nr:MurR/RpiR family transcriptional regulator [Actinomyces glycerinitolerans]SHE25218.1 sugar isomerase (sis) [Actinomyces glycerinitolerans]
MHTDMTPQSVPEQIGAMGSPPSAQSPEAGALPLTERIRRARDGFSATEEALAAQILTDPRAALSATTASLARAAGVSQASVVRFARALGYSGLPELRLALAQELSRQDLEREQAGVAQGQINADDTLEELAAKIAFHEARSIEQTVAGLNLDALERAARAIADHAPVTAFGVGASGLVASDLSQKLQRIGLPCQFSPDTHVQLVHAALLDTDDVAVGISFSGRTAEVLRALRLAHGRGALTVAVTGNPASPIAAAADLVLVTIARETELRAAALASRMAQLAVIDVLFARVAQLRYDDLGAALEMTRAAVDGQRVRE